MCGYCQVFPTKLFFQHYKRSGQNLSIHMLWNLKMRFHQKILVLVLTLAVLGDFSSLLNSVWTGNELVLHSSGLILPGANAWVGAVARVLGRAISRSLSKSKNVKKGAAEHTKNKRPSTKEKHQKGEGRRKKDQERAKDKKQKGGKDGSKKRGWRG